MDVFTFHSGGINVDVFTFQWWDRVKLFLLFTVLEENVDDWLSWLISIVK